MLSTNSKEHSDDFSVIPNYSDIPLRQYRNQGNSAGHVNTMHYPANFHSAPSHSYSEHRRMKNRQSNMPPYLNLDPSQDFESFVNQQYSALFPQEFPQELPRGLMSEQARSAPTFIGFPTTSFEVSSNRTNALDRSVKGKTSLLNENYNATTQVRDFNYSALQYGSSSTEYQNPSMDDVFTSYLIKGSEASYNTEPSVATGSHNSRAIIISHSRSNHVLPEARAAEKTHARPNTLPLKSSSSCYVEVTKEQNRTQLLGPLSVGVTMTSPSIVSTDIIDSPLCLGTLLSPSPSYQNSRQKEFMSAPPPLSPQGTLKPMSQAIGSKKGNPNIRQLLNSPPPPVEHAWLVPKTVQLLSESKTDRGKVPLSMSTISSPLDSPFSSHLPHLSFSNSEKPRTYLTDYSNSQNAKKSHGIMSSDSESERFGSPPPLYPSLGLSPLTQTSLPATPQNLQLLDSFKYSLPESPLSTKATCASVLARHQEGKNVLSEADPDDSHALVNGINLSASKRDSIESVIHFRESFNPTSRNMTVSNRDTLQCTSELSQLNSDNSKSIEGECVTWLSHSGKERNSVPAVSQADRNQASDLSSMSVSRNNSNTEEEIREDSRNSLLQSSPEKGDNTKREEEIDRDNVKTKDLQQRIHKFSGSLCEAITSVAKSNDISCLSKAKDSVQDPPFSSATCTVSRSSSTDDLSKPFGGKSAKAKLNKPVAHQDKKNNEKFMLFSPSDRIKCVDICKPPTQLNLSVQEIPLPAQVSTPRETDERTTAKLLDGTKDHLVSVSSPLPIPGTHVRESYSSDSSTTREMLIANSDLSSEKRKVSRRKKQAVFTEGTTIPNHVSMDKHGKKGRKKVRQAEIKEKLFSPVKTSVEGKLGAYMLPCSKTSNDPNVNYSKGGVDEDSRRGKRKRRKKKRSCSLDKDGLTGVPERDDTVTDTEKRRRRRKRRYKDHDSLPNETDGLSAPDMHSGSRKEERSSSSSSKTIEITKENTLHLPQAVLSPLNKDQVFWIPNPSCPKIPYTLSTVQNSRDGMKETGATTSESKSNKPMPGTLITAQSPGFLLIRSPNNDKPSLIALPQLIVNKTQPDGVAGPVNSARKPPQLLLIKSPTAAPAVSQGSGDPKGPLQGVPNRPSNLLLFTSPDGKGKFFQSFLHVVPRTPDASTPVNNSQPTTISCTLTAPFTATRLVAVSSPVSCAVTVNTTSTPSTNSDPPSTGRKGSMVECVDNGKREGEFLKSNPHEGARKGKRLKSPIPNVGKTSKTIQSKSPTRRAKSSKLVTGIGSEVFQKGNKRGTQHEPQDVRLKASVSPVDRLTGNLKSPLSENLFDSLFQNSSLDADIGDDNGIGQGENENSEMKLLESVKGGISTGDTTREGNKTETITDCFHPGSVVKRNVELVRVPLAQSTSDRRFSVKKRWEGVEKDSDEAVSVKREGILTSQSPQSEKSGEVATKSQSVEFANLSSWSNFEDEKSLQKNGSIDEESSTVDVTSAEERQVTDGLGRQRSVREERAIRYAMMQFEIMERKRIRRERRQKRLKAKSELKQRKTAKEIGPPPDLPALGVTSAYEPPEAAGERLSVGLTVPPLPKARKKRKYKSEGGITSKIPKKAWRGKETGNQLKNGFERGSYHELHASSSNASERKGKRPRTGTEENSLLKEMAVKKHINYESTISTDHDEASSSTAGIIRNKSYLLVPSYHGFMDFSPVIVESRTRSQTTREEKERMEKPKLPVLVVEQVGEKKNEIIVEDGQDVERVLAKESLLVEAEEDSGCRRDLKKLSYNRMTGETQLHKAARRGYADVVQLCINDGADVDAKDNAGWTALHEACSKGHVDVVRLLLKHGADPNCCSESGVRPIHDAADGKNVDIIRLLLSYGADPLLTTYSGVTSLDCMKSPLSRTFLQDFLVDKQLVDIDIETEEYFEGRWKFGASSSLIDVPMDIFEDVPRASDSHMTFESSRDPPPPLYRLPIRNEGKIVGFRNYYLLEDVLKRLKLARSAFFKKHKVELRRMSKEELCLDLRHNELITAPPESLVLANEDMIELVYVGPYTSRKLFNLKHFSD